MDLRIRRDMHVELVDYYGSDKSIVDAARVSYGGTAYEDNERNERLIRFLVRNEHLSPFRHAVLTYYLEVPIFVARQLMRHHVGIAWNELSGRYKELGELGFYLHGTITERAISAVQAAHDTYRSLLASGYKREDARAVLPLGTYTALRMTANLNAMMNIWRERLSPDAQAETRKVAIKMWEQFAAIDDFFYTSLAIADLWLNTVRIPKNVNRLTESDRKHYTKIARGLEWTP